MLLRSMALLADIFITYKPGRPELLEQCLKALFENTDRSLFRLHLVVDGATVPPLLRHTPDHLLIHSENLGLGPSINQALSHIQALNQWYEHPTHGDKNLVAPFVCYIQDDIIVTKDWLPKMAKFFLLFEHPYKLGFASGIECVEHKTVRDLGSGMLLKPWIRAANMFARREYWMSMFPIPRLDPETGRVRAKPNDGMGSGVDWWFIRNHANSVDKTGRTCLVFPGMMVHAGYNRSTWLQRELPESEADKAAIKEKIR
jgi:glycosyltransferase involved in cell wall biosynthesis